jgi:predicted DNA-binding transcriptional regulator YafY
MIFELNLKPTFDFFQVLLSYGSDVEVISPQSLREQIIKSIQCLSAMYL